MLNRSTNYILISSIICEMIGFFPSRFASFHPSKTLRSATWSLHKNVYRVTQNYVIIINIRKLISNPKMCNQCYILECCWGQRVEQPFSYNHAHMAYISNRYSKEPNNISNPKVSLWYIYFRKNKFKQSKSSKSILKLQFQAQSHRPNMKFHLKCLYAFIELFD